MALHTKLTMIILFINISLTVMVPSLVPTIEQSFWTYDSQTDKYQLNSSLSGAVGAINPQEGGLQLNDFGITDIFLLIADIISIMISLFFASFIILFYLPGEWGLILGIPIVISYFIAVTGWVRNG